MDAFLQLVSSAAALVPGLFSPAVNLTGIATSTFGSFKKTWVHQRTSPSSKEGHVLLDIPHIFPPYLYRPLTEPRQIRLWQVSCAGEPKRFFSKLIHVSIDNPPPYLAISYAWGDEVTKSIIPCDDNGYLRLTDSVSIILDTLLGDGESTMLWVDAVCIDQENVSEKDQQVVLMKDIYSAAPQTAIVLGRATDGSDEAMDFVAVLENGLRSLIRSGEHINLESIVRSTGHNFPGRSWTALSKLLSRSWFSRLWIIQEVAIGHDPVFICGNRAVDWYRLAYSMLKIYAHGGAMLFRIYEDDIHEVQPLPDGITNVGIIHEARCTKQQHEPEPLQEALMGLFHFNSTDPRDKVYGILGLAVDADDIELRPSYGLSVQEVYMKTARHLLLRDSSILILHKAGIGASKTIYDLPSWVPDWTGFNTMPLGNTFRTSGYRAALDVQTRTRQGPSDEVLLCKGSIVDTVKEVGSVRRRGAAGGGNAAEEEFRANTTAWLLEADGIARKLASSGGSSSWGRSHYAGSSAGQETLAEAFWRTLIANVCLGSPATTTPDGRGPASPEVAGYYNSYRRHMLRMDGPVSDEWDAKIATESTLYNLAHVSATEGRKIFTTERGYMGLGNKDVTNGDLVALLAGGATPFILRPPGDKDAAGAGPRFILIGESYVHGLMYGEEQFKRRMEDVALI